MFEFQLEVFGEIKAILIQEVSELPNLTHATDVFLDFETTSGSDTEVSTSPWHHCDILGIGITVDKLPDAYYIPLRHRSIVKRYKNLPVEPVYAWLKSVILSCNNWVNHNIKYDAHVMRNCANIYPTCNLIDTQVLMKLYDSNRFNYSLSNVLRDDPFWRDIRYYEMRLKELLGNSKDYAVCPIDIMTEYCCSDAISVRVIKEFIDKNLPTDCTRVKDMEIAMTPVLLEMESTGMLVDSNKVAEDMMLLPNFLGRLKRQMMNGTGLKKFRPNTNVDCEALICGEYGLPVLERTEKEKKPSFGTKALEGYLNIVKAEQREVVTELAAWKKYYKLYTSFTKPYSKFVLPDGRMRPDYNQIVQTGRMSCRKPNAQQLSPLAKEYIIAPEDHSIIDIDFSQIEFRVIVHYIKDKRCINAYNNNPDTDFHKWVQTMCKLNRSQAKTLNFRLGYGGGKKTTALALTTTDGFIQPDESLEEAIKRGEVIFEDYYKQLPTLKTTRWKASDVMKARGYVRTIMGRHRRLPEKASFKAFNTACQGTAADLMKHATIRLHDYLRNNMDIQLFGIVHDSWTLYVPNNRVKQAAKEIVEIVEELPQGIDFRVPIKADHKISTTNWKECK